MFENPRRGRQARNFTTNVRKILDRKIVFRTDIFRKLSLRAPVNSTITSTNFSAILILGSCLVVSRLHSNDAGVPGLPPNLVILFFKFFFFQSDRSTQYQETHSTLNGKKNGGDGLEWKKWLRFKKYPDTCGGGLKVHINNPTSSPESICIPIWRAKTLRRGFT